MLRVKSSWAGELGEYGRLIGAGHVRFIATVGKIIIGHAGVRALPGGGLIQGIKRYFCSVVSQCLSNDVQAVSPAIQLHTEPVPFTSVSVYTQPKGLTILIGEILQFSAHHLVATLHSEPDS
ncbi:hypothetical protein BIZ53_00405 [Achromobacter xylosoxidans]|nr:hypothetical protein BIZ53_00405 [Achromobacter xylosoxidans]